MCWLWESGGEGGVGVKEVVREGEGWRGGKEGGEKRAEDGEDGEGNWRDLMTIDEIRAFTSGVGGQTRAPFQCWDVGTTMRTAIHRR